MNPSTCQPVVDCYSTKRAIPYQCKSPTAPFSGAEHIKLLTTFNRNLKYYTNKVRWWLALGLAISRRCWATMSFNLLFDDVIIFTLFHCNCKILYGFDTFFGLLHLCPVWSPRASRLYMLYLFFATCALVVLHISVFFLLLARRSQNFTNGGA